jgi:Ca-activated chloride channel family protein
VTFAWPFMLIGLVIVPIVLGLDLLARRRRARYAIAFSNVNVLRSVVPRTPPWRRYLPLTFLLAALAALVIGLARPERAVSVERKQATVLMAMDTSGSMVAKDVQPTRLGAATDAARHFVDGLPSTYKVSLVPFATTASVAVAPTSDHAQVETALSKLRANGGTAIGDAITLALAVGRPAGEAAGEPPPAGTAGTGRVILLLSDGSNSAGIDPMAAAAQAKAEGVKVYTVAFGTPNGVISTGGAFGQLYPVPPDPATLKAVASATGGEFFTAADSETLRHVYDNIGKSVGATTEQQDVSYAFAGLGAVLLLVAGSLSMLWRSPLA